MGVDSSLKSQVEFLTGVNHQYGYLSIEKACISETLLTVAMAMRKADFNER